MDKPSAVEVTKPKPPLWASRKLTPMLRQYAEAKAQVPDAILMFRMGDFFEMFFEDAQLAASELSLTLTARDKGENPVPMAGVPHHAIDGYIAKLVARGYKVALCDQMESPQASKGIVRREITRLITPGTVCDLEALEPNTSTYLAAAVAIPAARGSSVAGRWALALLDLLAGELLFTTTSSLGLVDELRRMGVRELLVAESLVKDFADQLQLDGIRVAAYPHQVQPHPLLAGEELGSACEKKAWALALGCVRCFAEQTQRSSLPHMSRPRRYELNDYLLLDESTRRSLELTRTQATGQKLGSVLHLLNRTHTSMGARLIERWLLLPLRTLSPIKERADCVEALVCSRATREQLKAALTQVRDIERLAGRVALRRATPRDVAALCQSLTVLPEVVAALKALPQNLALVRRWRQLPLYSAEAQRWRQSLVQEPPVQINDGGIFACGVDDELDELMSLCTDGQAAVAQLEAAERKATGINSLKVRYNRVFGYYIEVTRTHLAQVPSHYVRRQTTVNAERFVTEKLAGFEQKIGAAKRRRVAKEAELWEALTAQMQAIVPELKRLARAVAATDAHASLAAVADEQRYVRPTLVEKPVLSLCGSRHPVIEVLMPQGERFVANDVVLDSSSQQLMLVTGPNMAGKSTVMRQSALAVIMAQMGGFVAAQSAVIGLCDRLFTRVGAQDNLGRGQSTFMVEMQETATILKGATKHSLVLLDEVGRGTSTYDGLSIAWAVAEYLHDEIGCRTLFATHYHELCALANLRPRIFTARMAVRDINGSITFLRQLESGTADRSYGIEVARLAQLPLCVLERAQHVLGQLENRGRETRKCPSPIAGKHEDSRKQLSLFGKGHPQPDTHH